MLPRRGARREYLWVNKDEASSSFSSSDRPERQRIFQFVQHQRNDEDRNSDDFPPRRRLPARSKTDPGPPARAPTATHRQLSIRPQNNLGSCRNGTFQTSARKRKLEAKRSGNHTSDAHTSLQVRLQQHGSQPQGLSANNFIPGSSVDPFSSTSMPISKNIEVLLKYYWTMVSTGSHVDKTEVLPPHLQPVRRYYAVCDESMRGIMQDKVRFTGLMVVMAARMVHLSRIPLSGLNRPEFYMQMALECLRERLIDCQNQGLKADRTTVSGMHSLALAEWICQRFDAAAVHLRSLKFLIPVLDFNYPVDQFTAEGIVNIDKMVAIETGWLPILPHLFEPGPLAINKMSAIHEKVADIAAGRKTPSPAIDSPVYDASSPTNALMRHTVDILADATVTMDFRLGSGFQEALACPGVIDSSLAPVLQDFLDCVTVAKYVWKTTYATPEDASWMCKRARAINYRLLALPSLLAPPSSSFEARKTEALRIALVLIMLRATNRMAFRSAQPNMRRLQLALRGVDTNWNEHKNIDTYNQNKLLLWVLLTGHLASQEEPEEEWFLLHAAFVAGRLGLQSYEDLHNHMVRYFYSFTMQEHSLQIVAMYL